MYPLLYVFLDKIALYAIKSFGQRTPALVAVTPNTHTRALGERP